MSTSKQKAKRHFEIGILDYKAKHQRAPTMLLSQMRGHDTPIQMGADAHAYAAASCHSPTYFKRCDTPGDLDTLSAVGETHLVHFSSPSLQSTHTHARTHTDTRTDTQTHARTHTHTHMCTLHRCSHCSWICLSPQRCFFFFRVCDSHTSHEPLCR